MKLLKYLDDEADKLHEENFSSSDEFRTVNHSFVEGFNYALAIVQGFEIELNENQQIVLDYLKNIYSDVYEDCSPLETMYLFGSRRAWNEESELTEKEEFQLLAAFAEWGMKEVAE